MNMNFGKVLATGGVEYAQDIAVVNGVTHWTPTAEHYRVADDGPWLQIEKTPPTPPEGMVAVRSHYEEREGKIVVVWEYEPIKRTAEDFNLALEQHLRDERTARGYDEREPSDYKDSGIARWRQDALDWIAHRDAVMVYGLNILNEWKATGVEPSYDEFVANLPRITWTEA